jgi:hypothetical protein
MKITTEMIPVTDLQVGQKVYDHSNFYGPRMVRWALEVTEIERVTIGGSPGEFEDYEMITVHTRRGWSHFEIDDQIEVVTDVDKEAR